MYTFPLSGKKVFSFILFRTVGRLPTSHLIAHHRENTESLCLQQIHVKKQPSGVKLLHIGSAQ